MKPDQIWLPYITIIAIFVGPIFAVITSQLIDHLREKRSRRMEIFRTLMRTRKMPIHHEHVGGLNLVEVEFQKRKLVINPWKEYINCLGHENNPPKSEAEWGELQKIRDKNLTKLIHQIAKELNLDVEQLDILEGNYLPRGWNEEDEIQRSIRKNLLNVLQGDQPISVNPRLQVGEPFPPPPDKKP